MRLKPHNTQKYKLDEKKSSLNKISQQNTAICVAIYMMAAHIAEFFTVLYNSTPFKHHRGGASMPKHRLQFDFDEIAIKEIDELREDTGISNRAELFRQALRFLQWAFDETQKGGTLLIEKNGTTREVIFPFWTMSSGARSSNKEKEILEGE
jgi:hypothetical protein